MVPNHKKPSSSCTIALMRLEGRPLAVVKCVNVYCRGCACADNNKHSKKKVVKKRRNLVVILKFKNTTSRCFCHAVHFLKSTVHTRLTTIHLFEAHSGFRFSGCISCNAFFNSCRGRFYTQKRLRIFVG